MRPGNEGLEAIIRQTEQANGWFTAAYQWQAIDHIRNNWLQARALEDWLLPLSATGQCTRADRFDSGRKYPIGWYARSAFSNDGRSYSFGKAE